MATKKEEFLQSVKARIDEITPGLYEKLEASSADTARSNGIAESDRASFITSETLLHFAQALLGNEITVDNNPVTQSGRRLFVPSPDQSDFVDRIIESGYMRGAHIMEAFIAKEDVVPGSMLKYENYDRLHITSNDLIGMVSVIAYSNESSFTDKEQDFLLKMTEDEHIKQSADLKGDWISDISNRLSSNWGINGAADFFNEFSHKKEAFERDARVTQAKETLRKIEKDFPSENPEISYNNTASNIRTLAENVRILATDDSERLNKMPEFTLCNGTKLFITPMYMGEDSAPMVMGIYSTDNISRNDIDMTNLPDGTIFYPLVSPEMAALIKASGGFSNVELNKQAAHDALVSSITSALETTNENDHTGLREKADQVGKQISKAVEKAKEKLDEKEIQGILDGIQVSTIGGHKLAFALENDSLKMKYAAPGKEFIPVDYEKGEAFTLIPDTERVEYFINMSDFERTVGDAKAHIAGMFADDPKMTDMTMGVVRHTDKELAYFNFHKTKDENGKAILEITDVTDPEFPRNIGTTSLAKPTERGDLDWVYYGATEAVVGEPYQEEEKVNKALEKGSITVADATAKVNIRYNGLDEALLPEWITLQGSGTEACICYRADNEQDFVGMTGAISSLPAGFVGSLRVQYPAVIQDNLDFPGVELRVEGRKGGSLTIAEGATLTARNVNLHGAVMTVSGTFIAGPSYRHSGSVTMNSDDGNNSTLIVTDTGILGGYQCTVEVPKGVETASCVSGIAPGQMKDVSHPYRPNFQIYLIVAEMSLPTGLQTIESEAFAGGSFNSVYIPEGVTSIAPDAFGDRTHLKVYGEYGTEAETFADGHGFPFAPPNLATQPA